MKKQRFRSLAIISFTFIFSVQAYAQQPAWVDYAKRNALYPESEYLTGFVSAHNANNEDPGKLMDQYEALAKSKVIQSIQVSIETNNALTLSNVNGKSDEVFESKSVSFSNATVTGLKAERYYDTKKKNVYAFARVNKKELAYYNRKLIASNLDKIEQKLAEGRDYLRQNDKQHALKSFYEGMPLLAEAEEAQWLLMATNQGHFVENDLKTIRQRKIALNKEISGLQQAKGLNMAEAAYFIAYGLFVQLEDLAEPLKSCTVTFENTGLTSSFSERWDSEIRNALVKAGNFKIVDKANHEAGTSLLTGNYWEEDGQLRIHAQVSQNGKLVAVAEGGISLDWLRAENISYLPPQLEKVSQLYGMQLQVTQVPELLIIGRPARQPVVVEVFRNEAELQVPMHHIPLQFSLENGTAIAGSTSNENGVATVYLPALRLPEGRTAITVEVDLAAYADIDTNTAYYTRIKTNHPVPPAVFTVQFVPLIYFVGSTETIDRRPLDIKIIEPALKQTLSGEGYQFVNNEAEADYIVSVEAATTAGNAYQGIYFSFVDATLSVMDATSGAEVFKTSVEQVKGGGSNSKKAGLKALTLASEQLKEKLMDYLAGQ